MNRGKKALTQSAQKKVKKEVHSARKAKSPPESEKYADALLLKEMRQKFPKKTTKKKEAESKALQKRIETKGGLAKKTTLKKKVSKRTGPGEFSEPTAPASINKEGKRWIKTVIKQNQAQRKDTARKNLKRTNRGK